MPTSSEDLQGLAQRIDALLRIPHPRGARVYRTTAQSLTTGIGAAITFDAERFDDDAYHSTVSNTSRLTIPRDGRYLVGGHLAFAGNATGVRQGYLQVNGALPIASQLQAAATGGLETHLSLTSAYVFAANDYLELIAYQSSGGALNVVSTGAYSPELWIYGPL